MTTLRFSAAVLLLVSIGHSTDARAQNSSVQAQMATGDGKAVTLTYKGCTRVANELVCTVAVVAGGTSGAALYLSHDDTYAVDTDGNKFLPLEMSSGSSIADSQLLRLNLIPDVPVTIRTRFSKVPTTSALQALVVSSFDSADNRGMSVVFSEAAFKATSIASQTKSGIRFDLQSCQLLGLRINCSVAVTNVGKSRVRFHFPAGGAFNGPDHSLFFVDQASRKYDSVQRTMSGQSLQGTGNGAYVVLPPGVTFQVLLKIADVETDATGGDLTLAYYPDTESHDGAVAVVFSGISLSRASASPPATGISARNGHWLITISGCEGQIPVVTCLGTAHNGSESSDGFDFYAMGSYGVFGDDQSRVSIGSFGNVLTLGDGRTEWESGTYPVARVDGDGDTPFYVYFGEVHSSTATATIVLKLSGQSQEPAVPFKNVPVRWGHIVSDLRPAATGAFRTTRPVTPDAEADRLQKVLATSNVPSAREQAAIRLWQRYGDKNAKVKLAAMAKELLALVATKPVGVRICGYRSTYVDSERLCTRLTGFSDLFPTLGDAGLVKSLVDSAATGRVDVDVVSKAVLNSGSDAVPVLMDALSRQGEIRAQLEAAGWKTEDISSVFGKLLRVRLNLAWSQAPPR